MKGTLLWTPHCPATWPEWARNWASTRGSLSRRLAGLKQGFEVCPVVQGKVLTRSGSSCPPQCVKAGLTNHFVRQRLVRLQVNNMPVVLAQTLMKIDGPVIDWHFWRGLGTRSLGSVLFSDPQVKRGELYFARLPMWQPWVQRLLSPQLRSQMNKVGKGRVWYARCAQFSRKPNRTPLWVMEVFLPQLEHYL